MLNDIFDLNHFNIIQDDDNYYFFRKLSVGDLSDIEKGITTEDGVVKRIKTDLSRFEDLPLYSSDDEISLQEVHDHVKWGHRQDTNCISMSTNANVVSTYGRGNNKNQYIIITVPKDKINDSGFYMSGKFLIEEIKKELQKLRDKGYLTKDKLEYLDLINQAKTNDELFDILERYSNLTSNDYRFNKGKYYDYDTLNESQNLEKNKLIASVDIVDIRLLSRCSNRMLLESVKLAFNSSEEIHYKDIEGDFIFASPITIDLFSLLQQAESLGMDNEKIQELKLKIIKCAKEGLVLENGKYGAYETIISDYAPVSRDIKIRDTHKLTGGRIPFSKAKRAVQFSQDVANSKLKTANLCDLLKEIADDSKYDDVIDEIKDRCYVVNPSFATHNIQNGLRLSDSVYLSLNKDRKQMFTQTEQKSVLDYITSISGFEKGTTSSYTIDEKSVCDVLTPSYEEGINLNRYYAETIIDGLNLDEIYRGSHIEKTLSTEEKEKIISYLEKANCENMYETLSELGLSTDKISGIIFNLLLNDGYQGLNFIDLSNSSEFRNIISSNLANISSDVSPIRLDYLLGIKDNDNFVPTSNITLRDYQQLAVDRIDDIFENKNFAGVVLPTGAGKSFVAIAEMLKHKDQNILYYAPNTEILRQLQKHILKYVLNTNIIPSSQEQYYIEHLSEIPKGYIFQSDMEEMIKVALPQFKMYCYQGLTTKEEDFFKERNAGLIVLDEVHRTGANEWKEKIKLLIKNNPNAKILGITATPIRDVDHQDMVKRLAELSGSYTEEEIKQKKYMGAEMYLVDAMQEGIVVTPNIVTFDYSLEDSEQYKEVKRMYESETNPQKKEELKRIYDDMRRIIESSHKKGMAGIIKEGFEKNNKPLNGRYIIFLPTNPNSKIPTEEYIKNEIEKVKEYFKEIDPNPQVEYLLSNRKNKSDNSTAISKFESNSDHLKLIFAINMLNEGVHVEGIDGVVMLRPLSAGSRILYYQQIGRCIYSLDPNQELEPSEFPIIFDVYNNYLEQNIERQVNRHTVTSDVQRLRLIKEWIDRHHRYPDINSDSINEARKAITLKRIQKKYTKYINNPSYSSNLSDTEIYEIQEVIKLGMDIDLWDIDIPERTKDTSEYEIEQVSTFKLKGEQKAFVELFRKASSVSSNTGKKSIKLGLTDILNILDVMSEYGVDINNETIPLGSTLGSVYSGVSQEVLGLIRDEITLSEDYKIGFEYNEAKKQFYKKNPIFQDYDIKTLRKMGIFEPVIVYSGLKDTTAIDEKGFIVHGPNKFMRLNIYTGTYYGPDGLDYEGFDENNFSESDEFINKYGFDRDGYYYEISDDGEYIKTDSIYNQYGFDIKGDYYELQPDGTYKNLGKIAPNGYDIQGYYYQYNPETKEYIKTKSAFDDRGFDRDGIYWAHQPSYNHELVFSDYATIYIKNMIYKNSAVTINQRSRICTDLPYDLNYFDQDGYYYILDENGNRVRSNQKYNEKYLDAEGYYYELQPDGTRKKTNRKYDDNYYDLNGYYYELQTDGTRKKTKKLTNEQGFDHLGLLIKYDAFEHKKRFMAFDKEGYCYEYIKHRFVKMDPPSKISRFGFDIDGYYHELLPDGTRSEEPSESRLDPHGFDECGKCADPFDESQKHLNKRAFDQDGHYWPAEILGQKELKMRRKTDRLVDDYGFDIDGLYNFKRKDGTTVKRPYNNRFLSCDGYYYKKVQLEDGTFTRKKTSRRVDARGFDLKGVNYDVRYDESLKKFIYENPKPYDKFGFDVDGIYYEQPKLIYRNGEYREISSARCKTNPPSRIDENGFDYRGCYCEIVEGEVRPTESKYTPYGFDREGYYKDLDSNGEKTKVDPHGFDVSGHYVYSEEKVKPVFDEYNFTQKDYYDYEHEKNKKYISCFDPGHYYHDETGTIIGIIDPHGFDIDGYYYELQPDGTRKKTNEKKDPRGFNQNGCYVGSSMKFHARKYDDRGFDIDGMFICGDEKTLYDNKHFDLEGYYYIPDENGNYVKTDRKYNDDGFDIDGYFYKLQKDGTRKKTNSKYNEDGIDCHGFMESGIHSVTNCEYDENYFKQDGINVITKTKYSVTGCNIDGILDEWYIHEYIKPKIGTKQEEFECVFYAKRALSLPPDKFLNMTDSIPGESRNKKKLAEKLYNYIVVAAVVDPEVKEMLVKYIVLLSNEIQRLTDELKKEKEKEQKNEDLIKLYEQKLINYREIKRKITIG